MLHFSSQMLQVDVSTCLPSCSVDVVLHLSLHCEWDLCTGLCKLFTCSSSQCFQKAVQVRSWCDSLSLSVLCFPVLSSCLAFLSSLLHLFSSLFHVHALFCISHTNHWLLHLLAFLSSLSLVQYKSVQHHPGTEAVQWDRVQQALLRTPAEETSFSFILLFEMPCCYPLFNFQHRFRIGLDFIPLMYLIPNHIFHNLPTKSSKCQ